MRSFFALSISSNAFFLSMPSRFSTSSNHRKPTPNGNATHHHDSSEKTLTSRTFRTIIATPTQINHIVPPNADVTDRKYSLRSRRIRGVFKVNQSVVYPLNLSAISTYGAMDEQEICSSRPVWCVRHADNRRARRCQRRIGEAEELSCLPCNG